MTEIRPLSEYTGVEITGVDVRRLTKRASGRFMMHGSNTASPSCATRRSRSGTSLPTANASAMSCHILPGRRGIPTALK